MNPCLENPTDGEVRSVRDALAVMNGVKFPVTAANAGGQFGSEGKIGAVLEKGRVLLLDDDPAFREIIKDYLAENGYTVVAVGNGREGIREILAGDFTLVLCDFMMPGLPGDMFYRAIERIRPELCQRFIFMTGHQHDATTDEFINSVSGFVLRKPFPLKNLLDAISFAEVRCTFQSVFTCAASNLELPPGSGSVNFFRTDMPCSLEASVVAKILARARTALPAVGSPDILPGSEPQLRAGGIFRECVLAALALLLIAGGLWFRHLNVQARLDAASAELMAIKTVWTAISPDLQEALAIRSKTAMAQSQLDRMSSERANPQWTPALPCIVPPGDAKIDILEVSARGETKDLGACDLRIRGMAAGSQPRLIADRYRQSVEDDLKRNANGRPVSTHLDQLQEVPGTLPDEGKADFVIVVTVGSIEPSLAVRKEGR